MYRISYLKIRDWPKTRSYAGCSDNRGVQRAGFYCIPFETKLFLKMTRRRVFLRLLRLFNEHLANCIPSTS